MKQPSVIEEREAKPEVKLEAKLETPSVIHQRKAKKLSIADILLSPAAKAVTGLALMLAIWESVVRIFDMPRYLLVGPLEAFAELAERPMFYLEHSWITIQEALAGFALGAALGIICGAILFYIPFVRHFLYPTLIAIDTIPKVALAPLFIVWFGFGFESKAFVSMAIAFFPLVINTFDGLSSVPSELRELAKINKASRFMQMTKIEFIYALPNLFTGMKISISMAVGGAVVGEFIAGSSGLGHVVLLANSQVNLASMFAAFMVLASISLLLFLFIDRLGKKLLPWRDAGK
ncbi:ABC transporter permease [Arthrobacter sp. AQ5-05]|uniref:ABC transporter permease n=1 Tax=Arthrobacter sp. AQ5-05 TaxID=2184581 RepID=UPI000DCBF2AC|nr:ABC transporter permease [Arthrobacter sp. AQ5-05]RAX47796.1 ABC transporter permease [Arthrobacter sp. AQ5-05]